MSLKIRIIFQMKDNQEIIEFLSDLINRLKEKRISNEEIEKIYDFRKVLTDSINYDDAELFKYLTLGMYVSDILGRSK